MEKDIALKRSMAKMADGRELFYFDREESDRSVLDEREPTPRPTASELRYDPLTEEWVAMAGHRQARTFQPSAAECPLCPSRPGQLSEIPADDYEVVVFENRFPSFSTNLGIYQDAGGLSEVRPGIGRCEVVCFTADHDSSFSQLSDERVALVMAAWIDRTIELSQIPGVEQVFCFENRGAEIGTTLPHPHGQIYAYPYVTPRTRRHLGAAARYAARHAAGMGANALSDIAGQVGGTGPQVEGSGGQLRGTGGQAGGSGGQAGGTGNLFADILAAEKASGLRVVAANEHWTAFVPAAARYPFEVHVYPNRQVPDLPALSAAEREAFGPLYTSVLRALDGVFDLTMPYVSAWHQAPVREGRDLAYLHLELFSIRRAPDKLKVLAGSESAMGAFVSDVLPEEAAKLLRAQLDG